MTIREKLRKLYCIQINTFWEENLFAILCDIYTTPVDTNTLRDKIIEVLNLSQGYMSMGNLRLLSWVSIWRAFYDIHMESKEIGNGMLFIDFINFMFKNGYNVNQTCELMSIFEGRCVGNISNNNVRFKRYRVMIELGARRRSY